MFCYLRDNNNYDLKSAAKKRIYTPQICQLHDIPQK